MFGRCRMQKWHRLLWLGAGWVLGAGLLAACDSAGGEGDDATKGCSVKDNGDGTKAVTCGGLTVTIQDGKSGAGCTLVANADGSKTVTCGGESATLANGKAGEDGKPGSDGKAGAAGKDATACTAKDNGDGTKTITCGDGLSVTLADGAAGKDGSNGADAKPCTLKDNGDGTKTITCGDGTKVTVSDGKPGLAGDPALSVEVGTLHGTDMLLSSGAFKTAGKFFANMTITAATADLAGAVTVTFAVTDAKKLPVLGLKAAGATVAKLVPPATGEASSRWVSYIYTLATVKNSAAGDWPNPDGTKAWQAQRESANADPTKGGKLTELGGGTYKYQFKTNLATASSDGGPTLVGYDRALTHRVVMMIGGSAGATADAYLDFVPDGSPVTARRDLVETDTCKQCHGFQMFGHGGDRLSTTTCVTCHVPGSVDPQGGQSLDFKTMIHKVHAGGHLASIPGADGKVWDDPATPANEAADNGSYAIWGYGDKKVEWWKASFPAEIANCTKCHDGKGTQVDNWKTVPSRTACGSCHDTVDFATGANHKGGKFANDAACSSCHTASGTPLSVVDAHDWTKKDPRNIAEYGVALTVSKPANGTHFVAGESPVVSVVLTDLETGKVIDHTTVVEDDKSEGCWDPVANPTVPAPLPASCWAKDGKFMSSHLFVSGPRAFRSPVLTTNARAKVTSTGAGPWDLSADATAVLAVKVDGGMDLAAYDSSGGDFLKPGNLSVTVATGTFANKAAVTAQELAAWLNGNAAFKARAFAWLEPTGQLSVRSRNKGRFFSLQLLAGAVTTKVFAGDVAVKTIDASTVTNALAKRTKAGVADDPKVARAVDKITYTLDPVDDLAPGTYVAKVELTDRGAASGSSVNYKTPSVAKVTFQVGQATEELPIARNCNSCHEKDGKGLIVDPLRHNKALDDLALDTCGACHDYQSQKGVGEWAGAKPISKRIHAIHNGNKLTFPLTTVAYSGGDPVKGRNWDIAFPQDVRNCETCHVKGKTSTAWLTNPNRLACWGCHDSTAAQAHMKLQTLDPTPADPYNGDETESCKTCH